jgi:prepilin-type N-terminal cleavage/methylation domain-containing protein
MNKFIKNGFTMIELLVVVSIIGILAALALVSFTSSQKQARDAARKSDLKQYSTALEGFANKNNGLYPAYEVSAGTSASSDTGLCDDLEISNCPEDPKNDTDTDFFYKYQSDGTATNGTAVATKYVLWGILENTDDYWVVCSNGQVGAKSQTSFGVSAGTCPL